MGLLIAMMSVLLLLISLPCIVAYLINRNLTPGKPGVKPIWFLAGELCLVGIMLGAFWLGTTGDRAFAESMQSTNHLRAMSAAILQYSEDWDGTLPPANRWQDAISTAKYGPITTDGDGAIFDCPSDSVPCGYAINTAVAGRKIDDIKDPQDTVLLFETRYPVRNASGSRHDLAPDRYRAIGLPMAFCDGRAMQVNKLILRNILWSPHETRPDQTHPLTPAHTQAELPKYRTVEVREVDPSLRTDLLIGSGLFLVSQGLLLQFWLWRRYRWSTRSWSGWMGAGWLLFLIGFSGMLLGDPGAPSSFCWLCLMVCPIPLVVAFGSFFGQYRALGAADHAVHPIAIPSLRRTWQTDPTGRRWILTQFALTSGLALLFCAGVMIVYSWRLSADIDRRMNVVTLVQNGSLHADSQGTITLAPDLASMTADGHVYLATAENERGEDQSVLYFPTTRSEDYDDGLYGSGQLQIWTTGYMYARKPLSKDFVLYFSVPHFIPVSGLNASWGRKGWYDVTGMD